MSNAAPKSEVVTIEQQQVPAAQTPMHLLNQAVANGNIELAEKLMGLHERWEKNQARKEFDAAIAAAKAEISPIVRNATGHNNKRYADFAAIARAVDPIITKHGLSYRFRTKQGERIEVTCVLSHRDGHFEETTLAGPPDASGSKNAIQAIGSTLTYLQRYSLVQALGLAAGDDDNGAAAGAGSTLTDEQTEQITKLLADTKSDVTKFLAWVGAESVSDIPQAKFGPAVARLQQKKAKS